MKFDRKNIKYMAPLVLAVALCFAGPALAKKEKPTHMDPGVNTAECGGCHSGFAISGTRMLKRPKGELCYECHGVLKDNRPGEAVSDIETVFNKPFRHPVLETAIYHIAGEELPETNPSQPRHVACDDCHVAHLTRPELPWAGSKGYGQGRMKKRYAELEYEICYSCHSDSANLPYGYTDKMEEFSPINPSYHPVERRGKNAMMPSLVKGYNIASRIGCGDCHGNNDEYGPPGPHGSDIPNILKFNYRTADGEEDELHYELCYRCHDRRSILSDESFKHHKVHVVYNETSCHTCHDSHGSTEYPNLIKFNETMVRPSKDQGGPVYLVGVPGDPTCYLSCHMQDHNVDFYEFRRGTKFGSPIPTPTVPNLPPQ